MVRNVLYIEANTDGTVGGSHTCLLELVRGLDRERFNPLVLFYQDNPLRPEFEQVASKVIVLEKPRVLRLPARLKRQLGESPWLRLLLSPYLLGKKGYNLASQILLPALRLRKIMKAHRVDLVHLNNAVAFPPEAALAARWLGLPCISHQRCVSNGLSPLVRGLAEGLRGVACVSRHVQEALVASGVAPGKCRVVYDGCDAKTFRERVRRTPSEVRREFGLADGQPLLCLVGNLKPWKGQRTAVEALSLLQDKRPDLTLLLVGSVADEGYGTQLRALVKEKGLARQVIFCGFRKDVAELMNAADIILHTSIEPEPFGLVVLEGAALAKPVIASAVGGPVEMIEDGVSGLLVPPGDAAALARAIEALLADPRRAQAMAGAGHRRLENLFSLRGHIAQVEALYEACLS